MTFVNAVVTELQSQQTFDVFLIAANQHHHTNLQNDNRMSLFTIWDRNLEKCCMQAYN